MLLSRTLSNDSLVSVQFFDSNGNGAAVEATPTPGSTTTSLHCNPNTETLDHAHFLKARTPDEEEQVSRYVPPNGVANNGRRVAGNWAGMIGSVPSPAPLSPKPADGVLTPANRATRAAVVSEQPE